MPGGYFGKILRIDLTQKKVTEDAYGEDILRKFIGGSGLGTKVVYDETNEKTDPLGADNVLVFMTGPLVGTKAPNFGRFQVVTKSPLTGAFGEANCGGTWGPGLKRTGFDGIIFTGKADKPVYVYINNGEVEIRDASELWGKDTFEVDEILKSELGKKVITCCIGQAGEKLIKFASIMTDGIDARAAGRCGVGAVMGSKNLKAIAVTGSVKTPIVNEAAFNASIKEWAPKIKGNTDSFLGKYGTACGLTGNEATGDFPVKNWKEGTFPAAEKISGQAVAETILTGRYNCGQCVIGCGRTVHVKEGKYAGVECGGPEYETLGMMGANLLIDNIEAIQKGNELCNRYGLDTITAGSIVGFTMEAFEKGLMKKEDLGGLEVRWGDADAMIELIRKIALREGFAYYLGEGIKAAAEKLGGIAPELAVHVRGMDFPAHDPRAANSTGLEYATSPRGACHLSSFSHDFELGAGLPKDFDYDRKLDRFSIEQRGEYIAKMQNIMGLFDSLTGCKFVLFGIGENTMTVILDWLNMVTGWDMNMEELMLAGERIFNLKRMYNVRHGQSRKDDILPSRMLNSKRGSGGAAENLPDLENMLNDYYNYRGWDEFGIPTGETLAKAGLE